jgi:hypothetical protein
VADPEFMKEGGWGLRRGRTPSKTAKKIRYIGFAIFEKTEVILLGPLKNKINTILYME